MFLQFHFRLFCPPFATIYKDDEKYQGSKRVSGTSRVSSGDPDPPFIFWSRREVRGAGEVQIRHPKVLDLRLQDPRGQKGEDPGISCNQSQVRWVGQPHIQSLGP